MAVTIRDLLELEIMKDFKVVAGEGGLNATVNATEILDFEFVVENEGFRDRIFEGDSVVLTSLLFAKDKPEMILEAVKRLIGLKVKGMAYKPIFFDALPEEALNYANQENFPILKFGNDEYFEQIIYRVGELVEKDDNLLQAESLLAEMIRRKFSPAESADAVDKINPFLRPVVMACCVHVDGGTEEDVLATLKRTALKEKLQRKVFLGKYQQLYLIILSLDEEDESRFRVLLEDVLIATGLLGKTMTIGCSEMLPRKEGLGKAVHQAFWAKRIAEIEEMPVKEYDTAGIYKLIVEHIHEEETVDFMRKYLAPVVDEEDGELLRTAVEYIQAKGDAGKTAERMFCHKNTIRYRLGKLQEKLDPHVEEKEFYVNLALAIKIYLLTKD